MSCEKDGSDRCHVGKILKDVKYCRYDFRHSLCCAMEKHDCFNTFYIQKPRLS